jgi:hypothetical protein
VSGRVGAYGFHLPDLADTGRLGPAPPAWPDWRVGIAIDPSLDIRTVSEIVGDDQATIVHHPFGVAALDRRSSSTDLRLLSAPTNETLVHPLLASTAIIANHWSGKPSFHGGAFVYDGRAWGVLGAREDGKSSTLGWMVRAGCDVLSDDVLVIEAGDVLAGPRCLDLRDEAAAYFGFGTYLGVMGNRERWRVDLGEVEPSVPLGGWISLHWSEKLDISTVPLSRRIQRLVEARGLRSSLAGDPTSWLELASLPFLEFARPRSWDDFDRAMDALVTSLPDAR